MQEKKETKQQVSIVKDESMTINHVVSVPSFDDKEMLINLDDDKLKVLGDNLEIDKLDIDSQTLSIKGKVRSLNYSKSGFDKKNIFKRIFK